MNILEQNNNTLFLVIDDSDKVKIKEANKEHILKIANNLFEDPSIYQFNKDTIQECPNEQERQLTNFLLSQLENFKNNIDTFKSELNKKYSTDGIVF